MAAEETGYTFTESSVKKISDALKDVDSLMGEAKRIRPRYDNEYPPAFRAVVVGIDTATWGGGRKLLSVQMLKKHPFGYGGDIILVDGWIDSPIVCGQEVLVMEVLGVEGDPPERQPFIAIPMIAVDQSNLDEPAETCTTRVVTPCLELTAQPPCQALPEPP